MSNKPLSGVKVMDLTIYVAGPACSMVLGYLGADVIKVESLKGDPYRLSGKGYGLPAEEKMNPCYDQCNGFKRDICVDFRSDEGRAILKELASKADIIVTNYRENALEGMGVSYEQVKQYNPNVVYAGFNGYGEKGPESERPGFDATTFFARSGFALRGSYVGHPPMASISATGDTIASMSIAMGVMAAYIQRQLTGKGCKVSSSLYGSALWTLGIPVVQAEFGHTGPFTTDAPGFIALSYDYECKDGIWVRICGMSAERYWPALCKALDMPEYAEDPRFCTSTEQHKNIAEAVAVVRKGFMKFNYEDIIKKLAEVDLPYEKHVTLNSIPNDPQVQANHFMNEITYENGKKTFMMMPPFKMDGLDDAKGSRGPYLGENSKEILKEYGFKDEDVEKWISEGKVKQSQ